MESRISASSGVIGQPNFNFTVNRDKASRYGINVSDIQDAIQTAVGGNAVSQVLEGDQRYDLVLRYEASYRTTQEAIENILGSCRRQASECPWLSYVMSRSRMALRRSIVKTTRATSL